MGKNYNQYSRQISHLISRCTLNHEKENLIGSIVKVKVSEAYQNSLSGHIA